MKRLIRNRQRGAFAVAFAIFMIAIIGFISLSMDLSQVYVRQTEMQGAADAAAVAAARELNGTMDGINDARRQAERVYSANSYQYWEPLPWNDDLMSFASAADGAWIASSAVNTTNVRDLRYVRIDTAAGEPEPGFVQMTFNAGSVFSVRKVAIAGPTAVQVIPLAICAIKPAASTPERTVNGKTELSEYGFRRGVTYNLLGLNPVWSPVETPRHYLVNPVDFPPAANNLAHFGRQFVGPFACSGTMHLPPSGKVYVKEGFPSLLAAELNSRFEDYTGGHCVPDAAVPDDKNIKGYPRSAAYWMNPEPLPWWDAAKSEFIAADGRTVDSPGELGQLLNSAHLADGPGDRAHYGTLWAYSKALSGSAAFTRNDVPGLYPVANGGVRPSMNSDPLYRPYFTTYAPAGSPSAVLFRRIIGVPLLSCDVPPSDQATVLGVGKFMLNQRAVDSAAPVIVAEFGGLLEQWGPAMSSGLYK